MASEESMPLCLEGSAGSSWLLTRRIPVAAPWAISCIQSEARTEGIRVPEAEVVKLEGQSERYL